MNLLRWSLEDLLGCLSLLGRFQEKKQSLQYKSIANLEISKVGMIFWIFLEEQNVSTSS